MRGLTLEGSGWDDSKQELVVGEQVKTAVAEARFCWVQRSQEEDDTAPAGAAAGNSQQGEASSPPPSIATPLYLNDGRAVLLATVDLRHVRSQPAHLFYQREAALVAWSG